MARIDKLDPSQNLQELETVGYTVPPVLSEDKIERARTEILRDVERKTGRKIDPLTPPSDDFPGMADAASGSQGSAGAGGGHAPDRKDRLTHHPAHRHQQEQT